MVYNIFMLLESLLICAFPLACLFPVSEPIVTPIPTPTQVGAPIQSHLLQLVNIERTSRGIPPLSENPFLDRSAQLKANDECKNNYFSHVDLHGQHSWHFMEESGYRINGQAVELGEVLERNHYDDVDITQSFMNSPTHRSILLDPIYKDFGYARCGIYLVEHFGLRH